MVEIEDQTSLSRVGPSELEKIVVWASEPSIWEN